MTKINHKIDLSVICVVCNQEVIIENNLREIYRYVLENISSEFSWEIIIVNDGSEDKTGIIADQFAGLHPNIFVIHQNYIHGIGRALQTGFSNANGEYSIVLDIDLSYSTFHIKYLLETLISTNAEIVIASPYMKGGSITSMPLIRKTFHYLLNYFMRIAAQEKYHTYTEMVRGYKTEFIQNLNLKTKDYEINTEILYKAMILRARIVEFPAHFTWTKGSKLKANRSSGISNFKKFLSGLMAGFIFRPYIFFFGFGFILSLSSLYIIGWIFYKTFKIYPYMNKAKKIFDDRFSDAVAEIFNQSPHAFLIGGFNLVIALLFLGIGFLSLQNKRYFEETFHVSTSILKKLKNY